MATPTIAVLVLDDCGEQVWGPNRTASYVGLTPNLDTVLSRGIYFSNAWGQPNCTPSRANALTGRLGYRTGLQTSVALPGVSNTYAECGAAWQLQSGETTIAHRLKVRGYKTACVGKWHLNSPGAASDWDQPRTRGGFDYYAGYPGNFVPTNTGVNSTPNGMSSLYNAVLLPDTRGWARIVNNVLTPSGTPVIGDLTNAGTSNYTATYAPTVNVNDAIAFNTTNAAFPVFIWLAPQAPHTPLQWPPYALHSQTLNYPVGYPPFSGALREGDFYSGIAATHALSSKAFLKASLQALDTEVGRLMTALGPSAWWVVMGDNGTDGTTESGTDGSLIESPYDSTHGKNTLFEGGVRIPLAISGPGVVQPGRVVDCPAMLTDVYETVCQIGGCTYDTSKSHDSKTLTKFFLSPDCHALYGITPSLRGGQVTAWVEPLVNPTLYSVATFSRREYAARLSNYKLIWKIVGTPGVFFYNLANDPYEQTNLTPSSTSSSLTGANKEHFVALANAVRGYITNEGLPAPNIP